MRRVALGAVAAALAGLTLAGPASAATKEVAVTPVLKELKGNTATTCFHHIVAEWEAWETASAWRSEYVWNGMNYTKSSLGGPDFDDDTYDDEGLFPPAGHHWRTVGKLSKSSPGSMTPPVCNYAGNFSSYTIFITVDAADPGPGDDPGPDPGDDPGPPPEKLTPPTEKPPPPDNWKFDARRSTVTLVGCEPGSKASKPWMCTAAVWDAHPDDPDASAPTGDVVWFAPTGKLTSKRCTLKQATAVASSCTVKYKPSSKTHKDKKQPVQGGYQGSKFHRPSSGIDGQRPHPVPLDWKVSKGKVSVALYCGGGKTCKGKATLTAKGSSGGKSAFTAKKKKKRAPEFGSSGYKIKSGETKTVKIKLNRKGRKALRQSKRAKLKLVPSGAKKLSGKVPVRLVK